MTKPANQSTSGSDLQQEQRHKTQELKMPEQSMDVEDDLVAMLNEREGSLQSREAEPTSRPLTGRRPRFEEGQVVTLQRSYGTAVRGQKVSVKCCFMTF